MISIPQLSILILTLMIFLCVSSFIIGYESDEGFIKITAMGNVKKEEIPIQEINSLFQQLGVKRKVRITRGWFDYADFSVITGKMLTRGNLAVYLKVGHTIIVDPSYWKTASPSEKAWTIIHEMGHQFTPENTDDDTIMGKAGSLKITAEQIRGYESLGS